MVVGKATGACLPGHSWAHLGGAQERMESREPGLPSLAADVTDRSGQDCALSGPKEQYEHGICIRFHRETNFPDVPRAAVVSRLGALHIEAPKLLLPMALVQSLVGEPFTGYLHLGNQSSKPVSNVTLRVEIKIDGESNSTRVLFSNADNPLASLAAGDRGS